MTDTEWATLRITRDTHKKFKLMAAIHSIQLFEYADKLVSEDMAQTGANTFPIVTDENAALAAVRDVAERESDNE